MKLLANKRIVLGVTGSIAAYKSAELIGRLKDQGAEVRVIMTEGAKAFITPLTLQALSGSPVGDDLLSASAEAGMGHIAFARFADLVLIAPASANVLARLESGAADDLLTSCCLATKAPVFIAPAMNQAMWQHAATQANITHLRSRGVHVIGPEEGMQACGDTGPGRMAEPGDIVSHLLAALLTTPLSGKHVVITAGPTQEPLDPVRYLTNRSSGKMGYALAVSARNAGARVTLISGPVALEAPVQVSLLSVQTAEQMFEAVMSVAVSCDVMIACAAVCDMRPEHSARFKIKKEALGNAIALVKNPDIVSAVTALKNKPFTVGFAAETHNLIEHATLKLHAKGLDMIFANRVSDTLGFASEENEGILISRTQQYALERMPKARLADALMTLIGEQLV